MGLIVLSVLVLLALGRIPELVSQSELGLRPQRRLRAGACDRGGAFPLGVHPAVISDEEKVKPGLRRCQEGMRALGTHDTDCRKDAL